MQGAAIHLAQRIGTLIHYYAEGWHYGHLVKVKETTATVRPIAAYGRRPPPTIKIPTADIEEEPHAP
jgi:hypothetical protein